ncbi:helix-turn-helix transcriptional regulator [Allochromatium humboldtianum]|uniref:Helix-turn-helix transcriptional regulator n=1 Tax=Allochromatium humboldtianum TaxID=504901 RepID=A0A850RP91_9GAMM|nr:helix-turn-helix domain-containing protein [Allochromatium humboldtianum]NVZ11281.1 helix-turn-helix transcriptional regulator [Allochromatium humboldtianum]
MTGNELRALLRRIGLTQQEAANRCDVTLRTIQNWIADRSPIPELAAQALRKIESDGRGLPNDRQEALKIVVAELRRRITLLEGFLEEDRVALARHESLARRDTGVPAGEGVLPKCAKEEVKMNLANWFNPHNPEHMKAYDFLRKNGHWHEGFMPDDVEVPVLWAPLIHEKMATAWLEAMRNGHILGCSPFD